MMEFDLGLWRSTLGETHPHHGFAVEMDYWPQNAHVMELRHEGVAVYRLVAGLVGCFSGGGGGSQQAMFRSDLVPLLEAATSRWRSREAGLPPRTRLDVFLGEVQRGFDALTKPTWHDHFEASTVAIVFEDQSAVIASTGVERAFRVRRGTVELVSRRLSLLDTLDSTARAAAADDVVRLFATLPAGSFRTSGAQNAGRLPWQTRELELEAGDTFLLLAGADEGIIEQRIVEEAIVLAGARAEAPQMARAIGTYLGAPSGWSSPPEAERATRIRWTVGSRLTIAVLRALDGEAPP